MWEHRLRLPGAGHANGGCPRLLQPPSTAPSTPAGLYAPLGSTPEGGIHCHHRVHGSVSSIRGQPPTTCHHGDSTGPQTAQDGGPQRYRALAQTPVLLVFFSHPLGHTGACGPRTGNTVSGQRPFYTNPTVPPFGFLRLLCKGPIYLKESCQTFPTRNVKYVKTCNRFWSTSENSRGFERQKEKG